MHYGGEFCLVDQHPERIALSLVFVQSKDGNTGGADPSAFGGGATDKHLIYEGLSRVAADAVLAGAGSLHPKAFFSVWHPQLVAMRATLGLPRHPAQIVISRRGTLDLTTLLFNVPEVPVILLAGDECIACQSSALRLRPWIRLIRLDGDDLQSALQQLARGRHTANFCDWRALHGHPPGRPEHCSGHLPHDNRRQRRHAWHAVVLRDTLAAAQLITEKEWFESGSRVLFQHMLLERRGNRVSSPRV